MDPKQLFIFGSLFGVLLGVFLVIGTALKWKFLINPPSEWSPFGSFSKIKELFGVRFLIRLNYLIGITMILIGTIFICIALSGVPIKYGR